VGGDLFHHQVDGSRGNAATIVEIGYLHGHFNTTDTNKQSGLVKSDRHLQSSSAGHLNCAETEAVIQLEQASPTCLILKCKNTSARHSE
jgi:hypothetical protein